MNKDYIKFFKDKTRAMNEYCAILRREEFKLVVNNERSEIDWEQYN